MKLPAPLWLAVLLPLTANAGPVEGAIVSVMRLSDRPNYTWIATVDDDARTYDIVGKTSKAGYTVARMPVINSVRRRLGRSSTDNQVDLIFRGNVKCVLATEEGWMTVDELPVVVDTEPILGTGGLANPPPSLPGTIGGIPRTGKGTRPAPKIDDDREERAYSNLQLGLSHPHEELGVIVSSSTDLKVESDVLTGTLTDLGAQLLLVRDGQTEVAPLHGTGTFKIWIRNGIVDHYEIRLEGLLAVKTSFGVRRVEVHQTTNTIVKDVGTTTFDVPDEVRKKLKD